MEDTAIYMTAPDTNGAPSLPKRVGVRGMLPSTCIDRTLRLEYVGAGGDARVLIAWERLALAELQEDR